MCQGKVFIIAEAGVNHNGNIDLAKNLVIKAKEAGVDAVKFQTFISENVVSVFASKADYQKEATGDNECQLDMVKKLELSFDDFVILKNFCEEMEIMFLSTPFDDESIAFLNDRLNLSLFKVPSGEVTNLPYLRKIASYGKKIIMSTGMCEEDEIEAAIKVLNVNGANDITLLHCNTEYPTPYADANLKAIGRLKEKFGLPVGYSDHTLGIEIPIAAVAMGAKVIEKHFTLDKKMEGPDHQASLEPEELSRMVSSIRNVERAFGTGIKKPSESEIKNIAIARKSIVARTKIQKGESFNQDNITVKRPGTGVCPMRWDEVLGQKAIRDFETDELIEL
jgi:N,N'-diacetyllegionaminate synthase